MTAYKYLDDPTRSCPLVCMLDLQCLYELASRAPTYELKEVALQKYCNVLKDTLTHFCNNTFFLIDFGSNQFGICLVTPSDMMHLFESGTVKQVLHSFVSSMSTLVCVEINNLIDDMCIPELMINIKLNVYMNQFQGWCH